MNSDTQTAKTRQAQKKAASVLAYETLKEDIIQRRIKSGTPLIEEELAARFQISRTPVRDMLRKLENDKLVTYYPYRGHYVNHFGRKDILEVYQIRLALECFCCREIVEQGIITDEHIARMEENEKISRLALAERDIERSAKAADFLHDSIVQLTGNERIRGILDKMNAQCKYFNNIAVHLEGRMRKSFEEHAAIIQAFKNRDARLAEDRLRAHILSSQDSVLAAMNDYIPQPNR